MLIQRIKLKNILSFGPECAGPGTQAAQRADRSKWFGEVESHRGDRAVCTAAPSDMRETDTRGGRHRQLGMEAATRPETFAEVEVVITARRQQADSLQISTFCEDNQRFRLHSESLYVPSSR